MNINLKELSKNSGIPEEEIAKTVIGLILIKHYYNEKPFKILMRVNK